MENKKSVEISILGWIIITSAIIAIWSNYFTPHFIRQAMMKSQFSLILLRNFIGFIAVFPSGLPWFFASVGTAPFLMYSIVLLWLTLVAISGFGILRLNNTARIVFIILNIIQIATFIFSRLLIAVSLVIPRNASLFGFLSFFLTLLFPFLYIYHLSRSKVKEQFK